jgi:cyclopropane fatty-acyl-phospholipid synthase-like methyltransferase
MVMLIVMGYFDNEKGVQEYIKMTEGYDGSELINELRHFLKNGATILELGMGPGKDLDILKRYYIATGSDNSQVFVDRYKKMHPKADVFHLDAKSLDINRRFDGIYSNKVLIHLTKKECLDSLKMQKNILNAKGILFHSFWHGDKIEKHHELLFTYYTEDELRAMVKGDYNILKIQKYKEFRENDSIYVILQKK